MELGTINRLGNINSLFINNYDPRLVFVRRMPNKPKRITYIKPNAIQ